MATSLRDSHRDFERYPWEIVKGPGIWDLIHSQFGFNGVQHNLPTFSLTIKHRGLSGETQERGGARIISSEWQSDSTHPYQLRLTGFLYSDARGASPKHMFEAYYSDFQRNGFLRFLHEEKKQVGLEEPRKCKQGDIVYFQTEGEEGVLLHLLYYIEEGTWGEYWKTQEEYDHSPFSGYLPNWQAEHCPLVGRAVGKENPYNLQRA